MIEKFFLLSRWSKTNQITCFFELLLGSTAKWISCISRSIMLMVYGRCVSGLMVFCITIVAISRNWFDIWDSLSFPATWSSPLSKIYHHKEISKATPSGINQTDQKFIAGYHSQNMAWMAYQSGVLKSTKRISLTSNKISVLSLPFPKAVSTSFDLARIPFETFE